METNLTPSEYVKTASPNNIPAIEGSQPSDLAMLPPASEPENQAANIGSYISDFLANLPEYLNRFVHEYKLPLISFGLIVTVIAVLKIVLAIVDAVNDIPLVTPIFELIGIGYSTWFVFRYLLKASTRQELASEVGLVRKQVLGREASEN